MNIFRRLKNLWELSRFEITQFDHQLVIIEKEGKLTFARNNQATIVDLKEPEDIILEQNV